jgi:hypothetical protein
MGLCKQFAEQSALRARHTVSALALAGSPVMTLPRSQA